MVSNIGINRTEKWEELHHTDEQNAGSLDTRIFVSNFRVQISISILRDPMFTSSGMKLCIYMENKLVTMFSTIINWIQDRQKVKWG